MPASSSSSALSDSPSDVNISSTDGSKKPPKWIGVSIFAATTVAVTLPLVYILRKRNLAVRDALRTSTAAPRRAGSSMTRLGRPTPAAIPQASKSESHSPTDDDSASPGVRELLGAISKVDFSTATYTAKAFGIATCLVGIGGFALVWGVKAFMGVQNTQEFAYRMRLAIWTNFPGLTSRIHRPPDRDEREGLPLSETIDHDWNWEDAEKRIRSAYDSGGLPAGVQATMKELEAEHRIERARRQKELDQVVSNEPVT